MLIILSILISFTLRLSAPVDNSVLVIQPEAIRPYEALFNITCRIESSYRPFAIGDNGKSFGITQIQQIRLDDYFNLTGIRYTTDDCFNVDVSREIWIYYACQFHPFEYKKIARDWNKSVTDKYWDKINKHL